MINSTWLSGNKGAPSIEQLAVALAHELGHLEDPNSKLPSNTQPMLFITHALPKVLKVDGIQRFVIQIE
jgi:hypothetical protein